ncbi:GTPase HflX [Kocuria sp. p3-SID1433]|uniref:GTPase HflX n=1 Tax=unclassified Kocuria TaxID=2649579 RepID=UPI0021A3DCAC|nr:MULTISPECIES: GTPase HflX [unclassified Kocuria]MCT1601820.1 GTPase HflX [Kocuria sp. p3-SID1428]MCT2179966.1 GTPase HflX [Kocuria sp. p3-SID1433]
MTHSSDRAAEPTGTTPTDQQLEDVVARVLSRAQQRRDQDGQPDSAAETPEPAAEDPAGTGRRDVLSGRARELAGRSVHTDADGEQLELSERQSLRRVANLSTELEDITEVEYRELRLEKVVLAGLWTTGPASEAENSLRELAALAETAGSEVLDGIIQRRTNPDPATYLGSGKALELKDIVAATGADTVVVDEELAPSQRRALEDVVKVKVIDRTGLILDIFAQHAKSKEGKAQVELAQLEYMLPRLRGWGESLSRQAGGRAAGGEGIGSRGPGETKIEMDRRRIRARMAKLRREIAAMKPSREAKRMNRRRNSVPSVAIAGYTNAGKSSLLNRLTDAGVLVENALFATLDPTVRKAQTPDGIGYTLSDTVGFVRSLPTQLVEAFRSTLEEVADSDVIVHVVDASHPDPEGQIRAVHEVLADIEALDLPEIIALNKADAADPYVVQRMRNTHRDVVVVSARTGEGIDELKQRVAEAIPRPDHVLDLLVPYTDGDIVSRLHGWDAEILRTEYLEEGTHLLVKVREDLAGELQRYIWQDAAQFGQGIAGDGTDTKTAEDPAEQTVSGAEAR